MSYKNIIGALVEYHVASNRRLWAHLTENLTDEQFTQVIGYSHGSIRQQVAHLAQTDRYWLHDIQTKPVTGLRAEDYPTRESFGPVWESIEQALLEYVQSLTDADLEAVPDGLMEKRWEALTHIVNHGTDHRAQILSMLHSLGVPTFGQDFADYLRGQRQMSQAEALKLIQLRRGEWEQTLESVPRERMVEPAIDGWSIKDIVAHITWHDREMVGVLKTRKLAGSAWWNLPTEERNQKIFEQYRSQSLEETLQEHHEVHQALLKEIEQVEDEELSDPARIEEMAPGFKLWLILEQNTWIHYLEHKEAVWDWLERH